MQLADVEVAAVLAVALCACGGETTPTVPGDAGPDASDASLPTDGEVKDGAPDIAMLDATYPTDSGLDDAGFDFATTCKVAGEYKYTVALSVGPNSCPLGTGYSGVTSNPLGYDTTVCTASYDVAKCSQHTSCTIPPNDPLYVSADRTITFAPGGQSASGTRSFVIKTDGGSYCEYALKYFR